MSTHRHYRSTLREEQARQTRLKIRRSARKLFAEQGFTSTTVDAIAKEAGVSPATVYAVFDSKAGIVSAMLDEMEESVGIPERFEEMRVETDPQRQLDLWLSAHCDLFAENADVLRAAMEAIGSPEVAALTARGDANRRGGVEALAKSWAARDALRPGLGQQEAADRMWLLSTVDSFLTAIDRLGWSPASYQSWLGSLLRREIFDL